VNSRTILPNNALAKDERFLGWLRDHGVEPNTCFKVKLCDDEFTAYCYVLKGGNKFIDQSTGEAMTMPPKTIKTRLPIWLSE
jgi:hypothetical protein